MPAVVTSPERSRVARFVNATIARALVAAAVALSCVSALAQEYPNKPIRIIVPFAAGGPADVYARFIGARLQDSLGQPVVIDDRPGAGSIIGTDAVAKSAPDGYTLLMMSNTHTVNETLIPNKPYQLMRDFVPVATINYSDLVLVVHPSVGANSVAELIRIAKANPGKLNYASSGVGTTVHLSAELFKRMAGVEMTHVAYRGSAPALNDLVGQSVDLMFDNITSIIGQARAGAVKPLGITLPQRSTLASEYPPVADTLAGYSTTSWTAVGVRSGTPKEVCDRIEVDTRTICQDPTLRERLAGLVAETVGTNAADTAAFIAAERAKWGKLITDLKVRVE